MGITIIHSLNRTVGTEIFLGEVRICGQRATAESTSTGTEQNFDDLVSHFSSSSTAENLHDRKPDIFPFQINIFS